MNSFGFAGVVTSNPSSGNDMATAIAMDSDSIFVGGFDKQPGEDDSQWRIEKRDK